MHAQNKWTFTYLVLSLELPPHVAFSVLLQKISQSTVRSLWNQILIWIHDAGWTTPGEQNVEPKPSQAPTPIDGPIDLYNTRSRIINYEHFYVAYWGYYGHTLRPTDDTSIGRCKIELKGDMSVCNLTFVDYYPRFHKYFAIFHSEIYKRNSEERLGFYSVAGHRINLIDLHEQLKDAIFNLDINA